MASKKVTQVKNSEPKSGTSPAVLLAALAIFSAFIIWGLDKIFSPTLREWDKYDNYVEDQSLQNRYSLKKDILFHDGLNLSKTFFFYDNVVYIKTDSFKMIEGKIKLVEEDIPKTKEKTKERNDSIKEYDQLQASLIQYITDSKTMANIYYGAELKNNEEDSSRLKMVANKKNELDDLQSKYLKLKIRCK